MPSEGDYWARRRDRLMSQLESDEARLNERLARLYAEESARLDREIASYYQRYGEGNVIEYRRLLASLPEEDRALLMERMDDFATKYPQYAHLMPVRESIYRLNELEGIQASIRVQQLEIGAVEQSEMAAHFERQARRSANLAAEEMGFGREFYGVNSQVVRETVGQAWASGKSFSDRIWDNRERLAAYLNDDFAKMVARGVAYDECSRALRRRFDSVSARDSKRLVYTEGTFLLNEAQAQVHERDFELYRLSCVHDGRACQACLGLERAQEASPARYDEREPGVNFPPMHPWCRCATVPVVGDWDAWIDQYVAKRGGDAATVRYEGGATGRYYKPRSAFSGRDGLRDLFAHDALGNSGRSFVVPEEDAPEGHSNIDLLIEGDRWEVKSPDGSSLRSVESNVRRAKDQFERQYRPVSDGVRIVFNGRYLRVDDPAITKRLRIEKRRHGIDEILQVMKDGSVISI